MLSNNKKEYIKPCSYIIICKSTLMDTGSINGVNGKNNGIGNGGHGGDDEEVDSKAYNSWTVWDED